MAVKGFITFAGWARSLAQSGAPERCFTRVGSSLNYKGFITLAPGANFGMTRTLNLRMMRQMLYHCATATGIQSTPLFSLNLPKVLKLIWLILYNITQFVILLKCYNTMVEYLPHIVQCKCFNPGAAGTRIKLWKQRINQYRYLIKYK